MNRNHLWKFLLIVFVLVWSLFEVYPPSGRNIISFFNERAQRKDATFKSIVDKAEVLQKEQPDRTYANLKDAIGTNDITKYFPDINIKGEKEPNAFVLNRLQRESAGKIKLGLDLQGGTSFRVAMDTTKLIEASQKETALVNAVEVLRRRRPATIRL